MAKDVSYNTNFGLSGAQIVSEAMSDIVNGFGIRPMGNIRIFDGDGARRFVNVPDSAFNLSKTADRVNRRGEVKISRDIRISDLQDIADSLKSVGLSVRSGRTVAGHVGMDTVNRQWHDLRVMAEDSWSQQFGTSIPTDRLQQLKGYFMQELVSGKNTLPTGGDSGAYWDRIVSRAADSFGAFAEADEEEGRRADANLSQNIDFLDQHVGAVFDILDVANSAFDNAGGVSTRQDWKYTYIVQDGTVIDGAKLNGLLSSREIQTVVDILKKQLAVSGSIKGLSHNEDWEDFLSVVESRVYNDARAYAALTMSKVLRDFEDKPTSSADDILRNFGVNPLG